MAAGRVRDTTVYSWLSGESRPASAERILAFLDSMPAESGGGITPSGYEYREYKNWRGIPKPRRDDHRRLGRPNYANRAPVRCKRLRWNHSTILEYLLLSPVFMAA